MDTRINEWRKLRFVDPAVILPQLKMIQLQIANSNLSDRIKNLRTAELKKYREGWEAAIFCYGMSQMLDFPIYISPCEVSDLRCGCCTD